MTGRTKGQTLADILLEKQILSQEQFEQAEQYRKDHGVGLERALVDLALLSEADLMMVYADLCQVRSLKLEDVEIDHEATRHVPAAVAHRHMVIPIRRSGSTLAVAMAEPANPEATAALRAVTDLEVVPFVARADALEHAIHLHYGDPPTENGQVNADEGCRLFRSRDFIEDDRVGHIGKSLQLNRDQTFASFVEDEGNQFALHVARSLAELRTEDGHNPLHCWGEEGCGKTHLLHAIANHVASHAPLKRFVLTTGPRFIDNLFECIRDRKLNFFRYLYRELDLLLVDEADALLTRDWAQQELAETFDHLKRKNRALVVASRRHLVQEPRLVSELRQALESGMIAGFGPLSDRARIEIAKNCLRGIEVPPDVLTQLVRLSDGNLKDLISLLQQVGVMGALGHHELSEDLVNDLIQLCGVAAKPGAGARVRCLLSMTAAQSGAAEPADFLKPMQDNEA